MKKLIVWEAIMVALCAGVYFGSLFCGLKPLIAVVITEIVILAFLVGVVFNTANSEAFIATALAFSIALFTLIFFVPFAVVIISSFFLAILALFAAVAASSEIKTKYWWVSSSLLTEGVAIFIILKYGYLFI